MLIPLGKLSTRGGIRTHNHMISFTIESLFLLSNGINNGSKSHTLYQFELLGPIQDNT